MWAAVTEIILCGGCSLIQTDRQSGVRDWANTMEFRAPARLLREDAEQSDALSKVYSVPAGVDIRSLISREPSGAHVEFDEHDIAAAHVMSTGLALVRQYKGKNPAHPASSCFVEIDKIVRAAVPPEPLPKIPPGHDAYVVEIDCV